MSLSADWILPPMGGNNLNTRAASLRSMNGLDPTPAQLNDLNHHLFLHALNIRTSVAGFLVRDGFLRDGSRFRFVSNSGLHHVMIWPAAPSLAELDRLPWGMLFVPADTTHQYGWSIPSVAGQHGTPVVAGDGFHQTKAGSHFAIVRNEKTLLLEAKGLKWFQTYPVAASHNIAFFVHNPTGGFTTLNQSAQNWEGREWISPDMKLLVTTAPSPTGTTLGVRVNGGKFGRADALWACVYDYDRGTGAGPTKHLLALAIAGHRLIATRRPMTPAASDWEEFGSFNMNTVDAAALSDSTNGAPQRLNWVKKVVVNDSRTVMTVWVQNPNAESMGGNLSRPAFFIGCVDFDTITGTATATPASGEVQRHTMGGGIDTYSVSGVRQISVDYLGDVKVFTELQYSGSRVVTMHHTDADTSYSFTWTVTDDREVWLQRGAHFRRRIAWVDLEVATHAEDGAFSPDPPGSSGGPGTGHFDHHIVINYHLAQLMYYGGKGELFAIREFTNRRVEHITGVTDVTGATVPTGMTRHTTDVSWRHATTYQSAGPREARYTQRIILNETDSMLAGTIGQVESLGSASVPIAPIWDTDPTTGVLDTNPGGTQYWGSSMLTDDFQSINTDGGDFRWRIGTPLVTVGNGTFNGHPGFDDVTNVDRNYMNGRVVQDFILFSVPKMEEVGPYPDFTPQFSPTAYLTYCSDPAILAKIGVDPTLGILKGIHLK
jgi:hypothetical protein